MTEKFSASVTINSEPSNVWKTLTDIKLMSKWLGEPEMNIEVQTDWGINSPIYIRGFHHINFENKGTILKYDKEKRLSFTHLSSVSSLADTKDNYTIIEFILTRIDKQTQLTVNIENFPTETIRKHLEFYWRTTVLTIKERTENETTNH
ncbi:MAG: SRPBCC domain-containing protein [Bacteroidia bacterium]|jgi:uncharacterized protein YndB with AHSA1/START domain